MNTIAPKYHISKNNRGKQNSSFNVQPRKNLSFKSSAPIIARELIEEGSEVVKKSFAKKAQARMQTKFNIVSASDAPVIQVFKKYYGPISDRVTGKVSDLYAEFADKKTFSPRFDIDKGITSIKEKGIFKSLFENIYFPIWTLPQWGASWGLKQAQKVSFLEDTATALYKNKKFRYARKLHELDEKTDILQGIYGKTKQLAGRFAETRDGITADDVIDILNKKAAPELIEKHYGDADRYFKENLYKVSNKFFDKNTGNFNTAHERPLNRIVSGLIPVAFLANDAYNLSVLCGDSKEDSVKEAKERQKQEVSRVFTTAYFQLLMFGAFTKYVNTRSWFVPIVSAATVLISETTSRLRLGKPITFLTPEGAKEYNKKQKEKEIAKANGTDASFNGKIDALKNTLLNKGKKVVDNVQNKDKTTTAPVNSQQSVASSQPVNAQTTAPVQSQQAQKQNTNLLQNKLNSTNSFKANKKDEKAEKQPQKALISMDTLKKAVAFLTIGGFALSIFKNSSLTKNNPLTKMIKDVGADIKSKIYTPYAFKDFEFSATKFDEILKTMKKFGFEEVADGHSYVKEKFAQDLGNGKFKILKFALPKEKVSSVAESIMEAVKTNKLVSDENLDLATASLKKVIEKSGAEISEKSFDGVATKLLTSLKEKKILLDDAQQKALRTIVAEKIEPNLTSEALKVETKVKPLLDLFTEPFNFMVYIGGMPYKIASSAVKASVNGLFVALEKLKFNVDKPKAAVGKVMKEIFGEPEPKKAKSLQTVFVNAMENLDKQSSKYFKAKEIYDEAKQIGDISRIRNFAKIENKFKNYLRTSIEKSFNGVTQSSNKNTDLAMLSKLSSSLVTSAFLVADNYNMVMIKSDGEDKEDAKEKANERIIQRLSALFYQTMFINLFNSTFRAQYNSSLKGMASVVIPNTITTEVVTRSSIGMPIKRKTYDEIMTLEEKNENRKGLAGKYFKFMRLLTGKKPLKERLPKNKQQQSVVNTTVQTPVAQTSTVVAQTPVKKSTNLLENRLAKK